MVEFKQTDIGLLPNDWDCISLGELFNITSSKRVFQSEWRSSGIPFYRARELAILSETGKVDNQLFIATELYNKYTKAYGSIQTDDILITGVGTLGKVYVVKNGDKFYFKDGNIIWLKASSRVAAMYVMQQYRFSLLLNQVFGTSAGSTVGTYTITNAKATQIPLPPLPEQRAIATALSDADEYIAALEKLIAKKHALKQGTMQELLTGKRRLPGFSGEWIKKRIDEFGHFKSGNGFPLTYQGGHVGYPFYKVSDFSNEGNESIMCRANNYVTSQVASTLNCNIIPQNAIVFAKIGAAVFLERKRMVASKCCVDNNMMAFITDEAIGYASYFCYLIQSISFGNLVTVTALPSLSAKAVGEIIKYLPPTKSEQIAIAEILSDMDAEIDALTTKLNKAKRIKQGMMSELLTGRIRLVAQKPTDETSAPLQ